MENVLLSVWEAVVVLWSENFNLATRSAVTSFQTSKSLGITDSQFTLLENGYVTYLLQLNGTTDGKGVSIVKLLQILISQINFGLIMIC